MQLRNRSPIDFERCAVVIRGATRPITPDQPPKRPLIGQMVFFGVIRGCFELKIALFDALKDPFTPESCPVCSWGDDTSACTCCKTHVVHAQTRPCDGAVRLKYAITLMKPVFIDIPGTSHA